ncbi:MAG: hypothetical protein KAG56_02900 [Sulfurovaceae bacterium]|nr:hypothetical protein [Sulfurovaceae bacterium]
MKRILFFLFSIVIMVNAKADHYSYNYLDKHNVKMVVKNSVSMQSVEINGILHVRKIEDMNSTSMIFWLENGIKEKSKIDINSIYAPFLVKTEDNGFQIESVSTLSKDKRVKDKLMGIVDILQFNTKKDGIQYFRNPLGTLEVNQTKRGDVYSMQYLKQYAKKSPKENITYFKSQGKMSIDSNSSLWNSVASKQMVTMLVKMMESTIKDNREFNLTKSSNQIDKNHWFLKLSTDISKWGFSNNKIKSKISYDTALKDFDKKMDELKNLIDNKKEIENWVKNNMNLLKHLSEILESKTLDDMVSKHLFSKLGYIDSMDSVQILTEVSLNENISQRERFRGMMGFKNTSAPMDDTLLEDVISYGLSAESSSDMQESIGMLIGALARNRVDRVPEQYEIMSDAIVNAINSGKNKTITLNAAGNMQETAPERVLESVENILTSTNDSYTKEKGADALLKIKKTNLTLSQIEEMISSEQHSDTSATLIRATAISSDNKIKQPERNLLLIDIAQHKIKSNRLAALETLNKSSFGQTKEEKTKIRLMMLNERDSDVQKVLRDIYRK